LAIQRSSTGYCTYHANLRSSYPEKENVDHQVPDGGESYLSLKWQSPIPEKDINHFSFSSEAGDQIDYYVVSGKDIDDVIAGYRLLTGKVCCV